MMIKCQKCGYLSKRDIEIHTMGECENCGNQDINFFIRIDKEDLNPEKYLSKRDKEWLNKTETKKTEIKHDGIITRVRIYESKRKRV